MENETILPNDAKTMEGKWYGFRGHFKVEAVRNRDEESKLQAYRITIAFPENVRKGIYPAEMAIVGKPSDKDFGYGCFFYGMSEKEIPEEIRKTRGRIKDLKLKIKALQNRNQALESRFCQTDWEREYKQRNQDGYPIRECDICNDKIDLKEDLEGRDYIFGEDGELAHLDCAANYFRYECTKCGSQYGEEDDEGCAECGGKLKLVNVKKVKESLVYNAVDAYLPKELKGKFEIRYIDKIKSKHHPSGYYGKQREVK